MRDEGELGYQGLMVDVDGVLVDGRPEDGRHWHTSLEEDLGFTSDTLHEQFFAPYWENIVLGRAGLMEHLTTALQKFAPHVSPAEFVSYWFEKDSRLVASLLHELSLVRSAGIRVYLATNQEHLRAAYLMEKLGLAEHVDGIFYSARLGAKKPHMEFFAKVQAAVGLGRDELLLIDDSRQNIEAALSAGWQAVHWTKHSSPGLVSSCVRDLQRPGPQMLARPRTCRLGVRPDLFGRLRRRRQDTVQPQISSRSGVVVGPVRDDRDRRARA